MQVASLFRRATALVLTGAALVLVTGCQDEKPAPPPNITVNPPATPPKAGAPTNAGPGSNAASDSTLKH